MKETIGVMVLRNVLEQQTKTTMSFATFRAEITTTHCKACAFLIATTRKTVH